MLGDSSDKKSEPGARILCLAGWRGVFAGLVLAGIPTCLAAFTNLPARRVALPIEVLGDDGTTVSCTVALKVEEALSAHSLWLRTNGLRYPNQGSIQINEGPWIPLNNDTVSVAEPGSSYGAIGGGFATLGMTVPLPKDSIMAGSNTLLFRFNHTDGVSSGYRVLLQFARVTRHKDLLEVPTARELASSEAARELIAFAEAPLLTMARPFAAPPGVPVDRARALQAAFLATHRDPAFLAEAAKLGLDISPVSAGDLTRGIEELAHATPATLEYMRKLFAAENGG